RLDIQHQMWTLAVGDLYLPEFKDKVEQAMRFEDKPAVLDVGCGSGIWSIEIARRFPRAEVVGLDLTPPTRRDFPPNFSFILHNLVNGLPSGYKTRFDIIHCRTVCQHASQLDIIVPDPQELVDLMADCLKPGGLLFIGDIELIVYDQNRKLLKPFVYTPSLSIEENLENKEGLSWFSGWFIVAGRVTRSPMYRPPPDMVKESRLLGTPVVKDLWMPVGWEGEDIKNGKEIGDLAMKNLLEIHGLSRGLLAMGDDIPSVVRDALIDRGLQESQSRKVYVHAWYVVAARGRGRDSRL
ncbi:S-adenosyl-L-methionine-dependent methyltransferase, partial [Macrolepiota fuliginosa MF-IS2]